MSLPRPTAAIFAALLTVATAALSALVAPPAAAAVTDATAGKAPGKVTQTAATADEEDESTPLQVRLARLAPAAIPERGPILMRGTVTNVSDETWQSVNVLPFISSNPITSRAELADQARTDETAEVAQRIVDTRMFFSVGDLAPGDSRTFRIRMPRDLLPISGAAGVYWIGAHALGTNTEGRDNFADGRVRTFIPLVPPDSGTGSVALVLPLREELSRTPDGRVADAEDWAERLTDDGRLGRLLAFAESAGALPFTWLIDPADLDAAADIADGNPPLSLGEARPEAPEESPSPSPGSGAAGTSARAVTPEQTSSDWLERLVESTKGQAVLGLGYGDPDVASLAHRRPTMLERSRSLSEARFSARDISAVPAAAPRNGWLDEDTLGALGVDQVLLSDHGQLVDRSVWSTGADSGLVLGDALVLEGGPAPGNPLAALPLRQRILADAALRTLEGRDTPLPVVLPPGWDPGAGWRAADFFGGLDQDWLRLVALSGGSTTEPTYPKQLSYPSRLRPREVPPANIRAATDLVNLGAVYDELLDTTNHVYQELAGSGLLAVSEHARGRAREAREETLAQAAAMEDRLDKVQVQLGTDFVTLSGGEGVLTASLVNDLEQPVTVGVRASTADPGVRISAPRPLRIGPGERVAVRLQANASTVGVHRVTLTPVTTEGRAVGEPQSFNLRTSQVGRLIWYILVGVGALLAVAIVLRIAHRVRSHRWRK